ncbi:DNA-deoxyinosine glycosylase [Sphingobacterium suaedae]|uniref:DNA-deoxyinosine glycosylase n=1 Tax=Sphingobacterium suaedae TaxID=1686402 RepID=A0ABW5KGI6_9SPHI
MFKTSFAPILPENSKILILGSLPGDRSLAEQQYYAHPQNRFWKTIANLFNEPFPLTYPERIELLHRKHIALWDVCRTAIRKGSMDTDINQEEPNPIHRLLEQQPDIKTICFNGQKAKTLYDKYFDRQAHILYLSLPSTSPANASFNQQRLQEKWQDIRTFLN